MRRVARCSESTYIGEPFIVDQNLEIDIPGVAQQLRACGFNARGVQELFPGRARVGGDDIRILSSGLAARVLSKDRSRDLLRGGGVGTDRIEVATRISSVESLETILRGEGF